MTAASAASASRAVSWARAGSLASLLSLPASLASFSLASRVAWASAISAVSQSRALAASAARRSAGALERVTSGDTAATRNGSLATTPSIFTRRVKRKTAVKRPGECLMTETISASTPTSTRSRGAMSRRSGSRWGMTTSWLSSREAASIARIEASRPISSEATRPGRCISVRSGRTGNWPWAGAGLVMVPRGRHRTLAGLVGSVLADRLIKSGRCGGIDHPLRRPLPCARWAVSSCRSFLPLSSSSAGTSSCTVT